MKTLGPGVRVYVGWASDAQCIAEEGMRMARCTTGTILDGPYGSGLEFVMGDGQTFLTSPGRSWRVALDDIDGEVLANECLLTPIDDDDPDAVDREADEPLEVETVVDWGAGHGGEG